MLVKGKLESRRRNTSAGKEKHLRGGWDGGMLDGRHISPPNIRKVQKDYSLTKKGRGRRPEQPEIGKDEGRR